MKLYNSDESSILKVMWGDTYFNFGKFKWKNCSEIEYKSANKGNSIQLEGGADCGILWDAYDTLGIIPADSVLLENSKFQKIWK